MSTFVYTAFDSKGKLFRGQVKEKSWTQALRRVKEMGLFPTSVKQHEQRSWRQRLEAARPLTRFHAANRHTARSRHPIAARLALDARAGGEPAPRGYFGPAHSRYRRRLYFL